MIELGLYGLISGLVIQFLRSGKLVVAAFQAEALQRTCALFLEFLHGQSPFQFQRRFSMPCAVKKRKSTAVVR